ncbi:porin [Neptuniibacter sp.]|uniref:porin n=1 Tax=Neptuniibacter sp. TaxID=1962643 RepID=UPI003B5A0FA6
MKKLILAAAIAAVTANTATAATVYDDKGLTFKIKGDWQVQLRDNASDSKDTEVEFDDLEIKNSVVYDLGNGLKAFGQLDFGFKNAAEDKPGYNGDQLEEAYVGLAAHGVKVSVGKQNLAGYEFGVEGAYETALEEDMFKAIATDGDDVIKVEADLDVATVIVSHELEADGEGSENGEATDFFVTADFDAISVAAAYQTYTATPGSADIDTWGVSAEFDAGFATFGADYSESEQDGVNVDVSVTNLVAAFKASKTTKIKVGFVNYEEDGGDDLDTWYANVTYKFPAQKNVSLFAEVSDTDDTDDTDVLAGMRIKF